MLLTLFWVQSYPEGTRDETEMAENEHMNTKLYTFEFKRQAYKSYNQRAQTAKVSFGHTGAFCNTATLHGDTSLGVLPLPIQIKCTGSYFISISPCHSN